MSGEFPFASKIVSPVKCNEKPWDLWVSEIGHLSPRRDDEGAFVAPLEAKGGAPARLPALAHPAHPYKHERGARYRRAGLNRLRHETMSLHGLFPQMDNLNAAVCHMCGVVVKCSAAYRHLLESHTDTEPILPPPAAPTVKLKVLNRSRHKKDIAPPPIPVDMLPVKMETSPVHTAAAPLSRIVLPPQDLYLEEASTSAAVTGEVQVCVESGELPVVSILDPEDQTLGAEDILEIMNSEGIQSADNITNAADWNNIIRDIGNMQEINFPQSGDNPSQDLYPVDTSALSAYAISDTDLSSLQFAPSSSPMLSSAVIDTNILTHTQPPKAAPAATPKSQSRSKTSKTKFNLREYDPNKHCGVVTAENPKPCTRSLTCKAHALSLRRTVEGRAKPFDTLLAEHRASRDAAHHPPPPPPLVSPAIDLSSFNGLATDQVTDIYASLLEDPGALPDTASLTSLLSQPLPGELVLEEPAPLLSAASPVDPPRAHEPPPAPGDVCWYAACPRPLALCTFNASHAGGAVTLGKKFATVRSNIKSSLSRSQCKTGSNSYYYNNSLLSKSVHMNASKTNKPEVRKLIVTCSAGEVVGSVLVNGHVKRRAGKRSLDQRSLDQRSLDLAFPLDPLLADEKC